MAITQKPPKFKVGDYFYCKKYNYKSKVTEILKVSPFGYIYEHTNENGKITFSTCLELDPYSRELTDEEKAEIL